jgi:hypothetical protein
MRSPPKPISEKAKSAAG